MKRAAVVLSIFLVTIAYVAIAQDCTSAFFPSKEGTKIEMTSYDKKGKQTGKSLTTIVSVKHNGTVIEYTMKSETTDSKNKTSTSEYTATCDGNTVSVNMKGFFPSELQASSGDAEVTLEGNNITFPNSINVGDKLNDGTVTMTMNMGTMTMKTTMNIVNRIVTGKEMITTPEGTFDCYKIEYDVETAMMGMNMKGKVKQWIAKGVGTVKTENYDQNGNLTGYSQITSIR